MICWEDMLPNEPTEQCTTCIINRYHRNCIIHWLNTRLEEKRETSCPCCRANMGKCILLSRITALFTIFFLRMARDEIPITTVCYYSTDF